MLTGEGGGNCDSFGWGDILLIIVDCLCVNRLICSLGFVLVVWPKNGGRSLALVGGQHIYVVDDDVVALKRKVNEWMKNVEEQNDNREC